MAPLAPDTNLIVNEPIDPPQSHNSETLSDSEESSMQINLQDIACRYEMLHNLAMSDDDAQTAWLDIDDAPGEEGGLDVESSSGNPESYGPTNDQTPHGVLTDSTLVTAPSADDQAFPLIYCDTIDPDENVKDPFHKPQSYEPLPPLSSVHECRSVQIIYLLVMWLHSQYHVPMRALAAILAIA